jgi:hypothetical protein
MPDDGDDPFGSIKLPPKGELPAKPAAAQPPARPPRKEGGGAKSISPKSSVGSKSVQQVAQHCPLSEEARQLINKNLTTRKYLNLLLDKKLYPDATQFLAHALPKRESVWWAYLCARQAHGPNPAPAITTALQMTEKWVIEPKEDTRWANLAAAEEAGLDTPAGSAAAAAFVSGGSLGPPTIPVIPPGEYLTAQEAAGAILLAAVLTEPDKAPEKFQRFLSQGIEVANGKLRWKPKPI